MNTVWKLMIADDEPKIRRGLKNQIAHMGLDIEVVAEADDGELALSTAAKAQPDILLVDINMPFLSGLDFIEQLKKMKSDALIIVITGFEEFEYAKRALELDVYAYLLTPVELGELRQTLDGAILRLSESRERERHFTWALAQLDKRRELLLEEFLLDLAQDRLSEEEIREQAAFLKIPAFSRCALMMIRARPDPSAALLWRPRMLEFAFSNALRGALARCRFSAVYQDEREYLLVLFDADPSLDEALLQAAREAGAFLSVTTTIALGEADALSALPSVYEKLLETIERDAARPQAVDQAVEYIRLNYPCSALGLDDVARAVGITPSHLSRLMKQELGASFAKYLTTVRISAALTLMRQGDMKIKDIAQKVGYSTQHYFSTAFKKVLGLSPVEYRDEGKLK